MIGLDPMAPLNTELVKELKSKEDILMRENSLLVEQTSVMAAGEFMGYSLNNMSRCGAVIALNVFRVGGEWSSAGGAL